MSTDIRVALIYQQAEGTDSLRTALANAGVGIAIECKADALRADTLKDHAVDAIVVNLDPELEDLLDSVTEALDLVTEPVMYNDPAASSDLSGWDRARWLRHLSAKLKGRGELTPPAPPGAQAIPSPLRRVVAVAPAVVPPVSAAPVAEPPAVSPSDVAAADIGVLDDLDWSIDTPELSAPDSGDVAVDLDSLFADANASAAAQEARGGDELVGLDNLFDDAPVAVAGSPEAAKGDALADLDSLFDTDFAQDSSVAAASADVDLDQLFADTATPQATEPVAQITTIGEELADLDSLFAEPESATEGRAAGGDGDSELSLAADFDAPVTSLSDTRELPVFDPVAARPLAVEEELADLDALFQDFEQSQTEPSDAPAEQVAETPEMPTEATAEPKFSFSMDWSLEPVEEEPEAAGPMTEWNKLVSESRLDTSAKPVKAAAPVAAAAPPAATETKPRLPDKFESALAMADLKLMDDGADSSVPSGALDHLAELEALDLGSVDVGGELGLDLGSDGLGSDDTADSLGSAELDFALDFGDLGAGDSAIGSDPLGAGSDLGDLDSLFAPVGVAPISGLNLPDLSRLVVLGASIGGPEAIKTFLGRLPGTVPAAFIVGQHMGAEFLEMMAKQLDAASPLAVRYPKDGERLRHGEVLVAPAGLQLKIDEQGVVRLAPSNSNSPYNPSIDQLVRDAVDRFGARVSLILFSGMGSDALEGGRYLSEHGGEVWAQSPGTCVIASMIEGARAQGLVRHEGAPAELAAHLVQSLY